MIIYRRICVCRLLLLVLLLISSTLDGCFMEIYDFYLSPGLKFCSFLLVSCQKLINYKNSWRINLNKFF